MTRITAAAAWTVAGAVIGVSGVGVAGAATGASFMLGRSNHASGTSTLTTTAGSPLSLHAPKGQPPLEVDSRTVVRHLDAARVGGVALAGLQRRVSGHCSEGIATLAPTGAATCVTSRVVLGRSGSWTVPAGVHRVEVTATGGGGGGATAGRGEHAGGGGAGSTADAMVTVTPGERLDVVVGAGGDAGSSSGPATSGGATSLYRAAGSGALLLRAGGGRPGRAGRHPEACSSGKGGRPAAPSGSGASPMQAGVGTTGSCSAGGGAAGWPGAGGDPSRGATASAGRSGTVVIALAG